MASPVIRGELLPLLQWAETDFDPSRGYVYSYEFKGVSESQMVAQQNDLIGQSIACKMRFEKGIASLVAVDSTLQHEVDSWEITGTELSQDIFNHPTLLGILTTDQFVTLNQDFENNTKSADVLSALTQGGVSPSNAAIVVNFYGLKARGTTDYVVPQYSVRHKTNISNRSSSTAADFGINSIYMPSRLLTEVSSASLWSNPMPSYLYNRIAMIPTPATIPNGYEWGWLKHPSTATTSANNRIDVVQEYVLNLWSTALYTAN